MRTNYVVTSEGVFVVKLLKEPDYLVTASDLNRLMEDKELRVGFLSEMKCNSLIIGGMTSEDELTPSERKNVVEMIDRELIIYCYKCLKSGNQPACDKNKLIEMMKVMDDNIDMYRDTDIYNVLSYVLNRLK